VVLVLALLGLARPAAAEGPPPWTTSVVPVSAAPARPTTEEVRAAVAAAPGACGACVVAPRYEPWIVSLRVPVWVPSLSGTLGSGSSTIEGGKGDELVDKLFDSASEFKFAFMGGVEVEKGPWSFAMDAFYVSIGTEVSFTLNDQPVLDAEVEALVGYAFVGYRFARVPLGRSGCCLDVTAQAGIRGYSVSFFAETANLRVDREKDWIDPIVGLRLEAPLGRRFRAGLHGDVGGFGIGSDLSWSVGAFLEWQFACHWALSLGWNVLDVDYEVGSGDRRFSWNLQLSGPMLAVKYTF
jgi:hypothetical protein